MGKITEVNGLRGVAILYVLYEHLHLGHPPPWRDATLPEADDLGLGFFAKAPFWNGWLAVNLFFVLSGFVLFLPYASRQRALETWGHLREYYTRRASRLLPLFYFAVTVCIAFVEPFHGVWKTTKELALDLTGLFSFTPQYFWPPCNSVLWSLGVEIWFCIFFPLIAISFLRLGVKRTVIICALVALTTRLLSITVLPKSWIIELHISAFKDCVFGRVDDFVIGMAVAALYVKGVFRHPLIAAGCLAGGVTLVWLGMILWNLEMCGILPEWSRAFFNIPINVGFAAILFAILNEKLPDWIRSLFRNPFLQLCGVMCYSIYVWHFVILVRFAHRSHSPATLFIYFALVIFIAILSYRFIEFGDVKDWKKLFPMFFTPKRKKPESPTGLPENAIATPTS